MPSGIQDKTEIKIDLVYTKLGRYYKMTNDPRQRITKYAFSDDGVNYNLYNPTGQTEEDRGKYILETPMFDAWTDENNLMRNKLASFDVDTIEVTGFTVTPDVNNFNVPGNNPRLRLNQTFTINYGAPVPEGFRVTIADTLYLTIAPTMSRRRTSQPVIPQTINVVPTEPNEVPGSTSFNVTFNATRSPIQSLDVNEVYETELIVESNDGLGVRTIPLTVTRTI